MKRLTPVVAALGAALALSACTYIGPNRAPVPVNKHDVGYGLMHRYVPGTVRGRVRFVTQPIYLLDASNHLVPSSRIVPSPVRLISVLQQLDLGPSLIERSAGYSSALPRNLVLISAALRHGVAVINFGTRIDTLPLAVLLRAEGQLVLTSTAAGATRGVIIEVAETRQRLPIPSGKKVSYLTSGEFQSMLNG
ncbi:MAG TPA: GerMN domain-containing protein [Acidimicrobiales bacterium]|nr:GerMN domain-containing protein [Acidimicrobiales bacterium]